MTRYTQTMREALEEVWANDIQIDEGKMKTIATLFDQGKSAEDIAKQMKLPVATVKTILGEEDIKEEQLVEFTDQQIKKLKAEYASLAGKRISIARANQLRNIFDKIADAQLPKLFKADIPFISAMAVSRMIQKGIKVPKGVKLSAFENKSWDQVILEYTDYVEYMAKNGGEASKIANMFKGKTGGGEISKSGSEVRIDSAKDVEAIHKKVMDNFPDTRILTKEEDELNEGTGTIKGFTNEKEKSNMVSLAKQHGLKVSDVPGGIELKGNMRKILDMQLATRSHLKTESKIEEAVLAGRDYKYTGKGPVEISKANFKKINKDYKKTTPGQEMMVVLDPKTHGTVLAPVKFTEETENGEVESGKIKFKDLKKEKKDEPKVDVDALKDQIHMLKTKLENEKNKAIKPEPNPDTGEVPLQVGLAQKILRDKQKKNVKEEVISEATFTSQQIKMAYGVANDKRYKGGDMTGAIKAIEKIAKGLSDHPDVQKVLQRTNEGFASDAQRKAAFANGYKEPKNKEKKEDTDMTKGQIKQVHKMADELPKKKFKDAYGKKGDSVRYGTATNMVKKKLNIENKNHPAKEMYEAIEGLKNKAEKSGMPYGILKKVYDRGMAAWKGGHRPGASQHQWAFARVNSFITKSSGTWGGADKDLAAKVKGS
jgi:hypothetical protein|tara:strand:+ start:1153 stop:3117 length:1965 start_codon:yes stop_codon:yes gene_type:complete